MFGFPHLKANDEKGVIPRTHPVVSQGLWKFFYFVALSQ